MVRTNLFRGILLLSLCSVIFLPFYTFFYLFPSFDRLLTEKTEGEAVRLASYIASNLILGEDHLERDCITPLFIREVENISKEMDLLKVKVFSRSSEIIFSTDQKEIGLLNNKKYFHEIVAKGKIYTQTVKKSSQSLEGQIMPMDVVETYVPIMNDNTFMGAFEIYYDITKSKEKLGLLRARSLVSVFAVTLVLFIGVILSGLYARSSLRACRKAEEELRKHQDELELTVEERTRQIEKQMQEKEKVESSLHDTEAKYRSLVESTEDSIYLVDREYRYLFMNKKHLMRMGLFSSQFSGRAYSEFHLPEETARFQANCNRIFSTGVSLQNEHRSKRDNRFFLQTMSPVKDQDGNIVAVTVISKDISERKNMEEELRALSLTDELTGLYNRRGFLTLADQYLKIVGRMKNKISILYADLDDLKIINDTFGHQEGDMALIETAGILKDTFRESDIASRIGGDEFVVMPAVTSNTLLDTVLARLNDNIAQINAQPNRKYQLSLSFGVAFYDPEQPCTIEELLNQGDRIMYENKKSKNHRA